MDTMTTLPRSATMDTAPHEDSQPPAVHTETDTWTVQDTVCVMMFADPALLGPGRMVDLPAGFTQEWVVELLKNLPGPTEPHDLSGLRKFCGLGASQGQTLDEAALALQRLVVSYQDAAAAATAVLACESEVMTAIEAQQKKADAIMKQLDVLCEKGKLSTEQVGQKQAAVKQQLQASTDALQNDLHGKMAKQSDKQLECVDATLRLHALIIQKPVDAPAPESTQLQVNEPTGDVETAQDIELDTFEAELSAFLDPPLQSPVSGVPCKVSEPQICACHDSTCARSSSTVPNRCGMHRLRMPLFVCLHKWKSPTWMHPSSSLYMWSSMTMMMSRMAAVVHLRGWCQVHRRQI